MTAFWTFVGGLLLGHVIGITHGLELADRWRVVAWKRERYDINPALRRRP